MELYPNLRVLRLQHNYKQDYVADALGMSQPEYSKLENGQRKLDAVILRELCKLYDVTSDIILQTTAIKSRRTGNANVRNDSPESVRNENPDLSQVPRELLDKIMFNYTQLLESYIHQQSVQEEFIRKFIENATPEQKKTDAASAAKSI